MDLDEGLQEWRYRHVKMVERTIGTKRGTGGSDGAHYLRTTLGRPLFPDLWEIRADCSSDETALRAATTRGSASPSECCLTGHSHQAWPDVGFEAQQRAWLDAAEFVDDKWERAAEQAAAVRAGFARLLGD